MKKIVCVILTMIMVLSLVACSSLEETVTDASDASTSNATSSGNTDVEMTSIGTPRAETFIVDMDDGTQADPTQLNPYLSGGVSLDCGLQQVLYESLYDYLPATSEIIPLLAENMAEPMDDTYTKFKVKLREGVKWSDGEDFTSADVVFTSEMLLNTPELTYSAAFSKTIKSISAVDDYTIIIETNEKITRIESFFTISRASFKVVPKHIWENEDPTIYKNEGCISTGPYCMKDIDPNGNWILYEKREDWDCSATGIISGEPAPKYVEWISYGTEDKRLMAAINNELDGVTSVSLDNWDVLKEGNAEYVSWQDSFPYGYGGANIFSVMFNCSVEPFDNSDVRWALALAINLNDVSLLSSSGGFRASALAIGCSYAHASTYYEPMKEWLKNFTLSDGYKPFDENYAKDILNILKEKGVEGLPSEENAASVFGIGWWKNDTQEAEKLLLANGFSRDQNGKWLKPDGNPFLINITVKAGISYLEKTAQVVAQGWQDFGIDAVVQSSEAATCETNVSTGNIDCYIGWPNKSTNIDLTTEICNWDSDNIMPNGESTPSGYNTGGCLRWVNDKVDAIADELIGLQSDDPRVTELITEFFKEVVTYCPSISMYSDNQINAASTRYWTGFPSSEDDYMNLDWTQSYLKYMLTHLKAAENLIPFNLHF